jgi:hypothetical protein
MPRSLTIPLLQKEASVFAKAESKHSEPSLFGVTDGKAVGTYLEHKFQIALQRRYGYARGSSAKGIDFPKLGVDIKVTSIRQPQSSCPFKNARQKIYGLGYSLLVFVYDKRDDEATRPVGWTSNTLSSSRRSARRITRQHQVCSDCWRTMRTVTTFWPSSRNGCCPLTKSKPLALPMKFSVLRRPLAI